MHADKKDCFLVNVSYLVRNTFDGFPYESNVIFSHH